MTRRATMVVEPKAIERATIDILRLAVSDARAAAGLENAGLDDYEVHVTVIERIRPSSPGPGSTSAGGGP